MNSINGYYKAIRNILFTNQKIDFSHKFDLLPDLYGHWQKNKRTMNSLGIFMFGFGLSTFRQSPIYNWMGFLQFSGDSKIIVMIIMMNHRANWKLQLYPWNNKDQQTHLFKLGLLCLTRPDNQKKRLCVLFWHYLGQFWFGLAVVVTTSYIIVYFTNQGFVLDSVRLG